MDIRDSWLTLNLIPGMGSCSGRRLFRSFGSVDEIFKVSANDLSNIEGIGPALAKRISSFEPEKGLKKEKDLMALHGIDFITFEDLDYPEFLRQIFDPPLVLYFKGRILPDDRISLAVVGSRRPTLYGKYVAQDIAKKLAGKGLAIVSGMARGIDTQAHRGALNAHGRTIAVLGSGLDRVYPPENKSLMDAISANGAVVSEFPMGTEPFKQNFPLRNRIISGMTLGTLVVEAGSVSGALITARLALDQGREVFAVPGPINSWASKGTNGLIKQGAKLVEDVEDIIEELGPHLGSILLKEKNAEKGSISSDDGDDPILSILIKDPVHIDALIEKTGIPAHKMVSRLIQLEMQGIIRKLPGNMYSKL
ncbi:MAG: DNA-processing protein DprA [bacterium]